MEVPGLADPLAYRPAEALEVFPIGRTALYELLRSGEIESFRVGRARFIPRRSLVAYMERQLSEEQEAAARAR
jgi:excisionase family DNA binding protein